MEQEGSVNPERSSAAEQPADEITEGRIGDMAAIVIHGLEIPSLSRYCSPTQDRLSVPLVMQARSDLKKPEIQEPRLLANVSVARIRRAGRMLMFVKVCDLKKPEIGHGSRSSTRVRVRVITEAALAIGRAAPASLPPAAPTNPPPTGSIRRRRSGCGYPARAATPGLPARCHPGSCCGWRRRCSQRARRTWGLSDIEA